MQNKFLIMLFGLVLFCGKVQALPQDWPCDMFTLYPIEQLSDYVYNFKGTFRNYEVTIEKLDMEFPYAYCGNAGCMGKIKDLKTGKEEYMYFDCGHNLDNNTLDCGRISTDEYIFTKFSDDEYRVELCEGSYYKYIKTNECEDCSCVVKDSRPKEGVENTDWHMICLQKHEDNKLRCYSHNEYDVRLEFYNKPDDFKNCVW